MVLALGRNRTLLLLLKHHLQALNISTLIPHQSLLLDQCLQHLEYLGLVCIAHLLITELLAAHPLLLIDWHILLLLRSKERACSCMLLSAASVLPLDAFALSSLS